MGESRPVSAATGPPRTTSGLAPIWQAYSDYVAHAVRCEVCRSVESDAGPCVPAEGLWDAYRRLRREQRTLSASDR